MGWTVPLSMQRPTRASSASGMDPMQTGGREATSAVARAGVNPYRRAATVLLEDVVDTTTRGRIATSCGDGGSASNGPGPRPSGPVLGLTFLPTPAHPFGATCPAAEARGTPDGGAKPTTSGLVPRCTCPGSGSRPMSRSRRTSPRTPACSTARSCRRRGTRTVKDDMRANTNIDRTVPAVHLHIGAEKLGSGSAGTHEHVNPCTGEVDAHVPLAGADDVDRAATVAHEAYTPWRTTRPAKRRRLLLRLADLIEANGDERPDAERSTTGRRSVSPRPRARRRSNGPATTPAGPTRSAATSPRRTATPASSVTPSRNPTAWSASSPRGTVRSSRWP